MISMQQVRQKYPQYSDMSDAQLAGALHQKYYSDMPAAQFNQKIGLTSGAPAQSGIGSLFNNDIARPAETLGADALTGIANGMYGAASLIPGFSSVVPKPESINAAAGLPQNGADRLVQGLASFAPVAVGGEALAGPKMMSEAAEALGNSTAEKGLLNASKYAGEGGAYSATQGQNPLGGMALGAAGPALGGLGSGLLSRYSSAIAKRAAPGLGRAALSVLGDTPTETLTNTVNQLKNNYLNKMDEYKDLDAQANAHAATADSAVAAANSSPPKYLVTAPPKSIFSNQSYLDSLDQLKGGIVNKSNGQPALLRQASPALAAIDEWKANAPTDFTSSIAARRGINATVKNYEADNTPNSILKSSAGVARNALIDMMQKNGDSLSDIPEAQQFMSTWNKSNQAYQAAKAFEALPNSKGLLQPNRQLRGAFSQNSTPNPDLISNYIPKSNSFDISKMQHLSGLLGNQQDAANAIKSQMFKNSIAADGSPRPSLYTKYQNLTDPQKQFLFTPQENSLMGNAAKLRNATNNTSLLDSYFAPATLGGMAAKAVGFSHGSGMLGAIGLKNALENYAVRRAATPVGAEKILSRINAAPASAPTVLSLPLINGNYTNG